MTPRSNRTLIGPGAVTGEPGPVGRGFPFLDPLLGRAALVVEANDGPVCSGHGGDDEPYPGEKFAEMMLDFRDHPAWAVPGGGLVVEAAVADQRRVTRSATRPRQQIFDLPLQHIIGREANCVPDL